MDLLNSISLSVAAFIFVLGVMIFVHELGHYAMAKYLGVRVEVFSLGFGWRLIGFRCGETDYRISALPLGGYVKMAGENHEDELTGAPDEFLSHPKLHRFAIAIAGPLMNLALAVTLLSFSYMLGVTVPSYFSQPAVIGKIEEGSRAEGAGLKIKDQIVAINGKATPTWQNVEFGIGTSPDQPLTLTIEREGRFISKAVVPSATKRTQVGTIGVAPFQPCILSRVEPGAPAAQAGLQAGDEILEVKDSQRTASGVYDIPELISDSEGQALDFRVRRNEEVFSRIIAPVRMDQSVRIGIEVSLLVTVTEKYGFFRAVAKSVKRNYELTLLIFEIVGRIISGRTSFRALSGPIEIARFSGQAAAMGAIPLMGLMALISLNLGILNLFPIPILDGGVIALLAIEGLRGRDLSVGVKERISQIGFFFLILLMGIVIFNDLSKNFPILE